MVQLQSGRTIRIHVDQIRANTSVQESTETDGAWDTHEVPTESMEPSVETPPRPLRRSTRVGHPPVRYSPSWGKRESVISWTLNTHHCTLNFSNYYAEGRSHGIR